MDIVFTLIGGLGLGHLLTTIVNHFLLKKSEKDGLEYKEKREAYLGLLDALHQAAVAPSDLNSKNFALWQIRIELFGNNKVAEAVQGIIDTNNGPREERNKYFQLLIKEMRNDLGINLSSS